MALPRIRGIGVTVVAAIAVSAAVAAPAIASPGLAPGISTYKTWRKGVYYLASSFKRVAGPAAQLRQQAQGRLTPHRPLW
jgi:hypothetical protein